MGTTSGKTTRRILLTNLTFWVFIAIVAGIALGHFAPATAVKMEIIGKSFVSLIKLFIAPIIFLTIVLGISGMGDLKKVGRIGLKSLIYFEIVSTIALSIGVAMALLLKPGHIDKTMIPVQDPSKYTGESQFSWLQFLYANTTIQILLVAIVVGIALNFSTHRQRVIGVLGSISDKVFIALKYVMYLAPLVRFWGNGVYHRQIWLAHPGAIGQADGNHVPYHGAVHYFYTRRHLAVLQGIYLPFPVIYRRRAAAGIGHFLFRIGPAIYYE